MSALTADALARHEANVRATETRAPEPVSPPRTATTGGSEMSDAAEASFGAVDGAQRGPSARLSSDSRPLTLPSIQPLRPLAGRVPVAQDTAPMDPQRSSAERLRLFLAKFVPQQVLLDLADSTRAPSREASGGTDPIVNHLMAAVGFFDVSAVSKLCDRVQTTPQASRSAASSHSGRSFGVGGVGGVGGGSATQGADALDFTMNTALGVVVDLIVASGGDVIKFAGDAVIALWAQEELTVNVWRAAHCASAAAAASFAQEGEGDSLGPGCGGVRVGLAAGPASLIHVGGVQGRWETTVLGLPMVQAFDAVEGGEKLTRGLMVPPTGQIILHETAHRALGLPAAGSGSSSRQHSLSRSRSYNSSIGRAANEGWTASTSPLVYPPTSTASGGSVGRRSSTGSSSGLWMLEKLEADLPPVPVEPLPPVSVEAIQQYVPDALLVSSPGSRAGESGSLRKVTVVFIKIADITKSQLVSTSQERLVRSLHSRLQRIQTVISKCGATLRQFIVDDKGCVIIAALGLPPLCHDDDAVRGVAIASTLCERYPVSVGVTTGVAFCGIIGSKTRSEYSIVGDCVNFSARLMGKAGVQEFVMDSRTRTEGGQVSGVVTAEFAQIRGRTATIEVFRVRRSQGPGETVMPAFAAVGRQTQMETLRRVCSSPAPKFVVIEGAHGMGKSLLLSQVDQFRPPTHVHLVGVGEEGEQHTRFHVLRSILYTLLELRINLERGETVMAPPATIQEGERSQRRRSSLKQMVSRLASRTSVAQDPTSEASLSPRSDGDSRGMRSPPSSGRESSSKGRFGSTPSSAGSSWREKSESRKSNSDGRDPDSQAGWSAAEQQPLEPLRVPPTLKADDRHGNRRWSLRDAAPVSTSTQSILNKPTKPSGLMPSRDLGSRLFSQRRAMSAKSSDLLRYLLETEQLTEEDVYRLGCIVPMRLSRNSSVAVAANPPPEEVARVLSVLLQGLLCAVPASIVIDDAHFMDDASWIVLATITRQVPEISVILALNPDAPALDVFAKILDVREEEGQTCKRVELLGFSNFEVLQLLVANLGVSTVEPSIVDAIHEQSRGVPAAVVQTLNAMLQSGHIAVEGSSLVTKADLADIDVPVTAAEREDTMRRYEPLTRSAKFLLSLLSVGGDVLPMSLVRFLIVLGQKAIPQSVLNGSSANEILAGPLDELTANKLVELSATEDAVIFSAEHVRFIVYRLLLPTHRRIIHKLVVQWYLNTNSEEALQPLLEDLGYHCVCSKQWDQAARFFLQAAAVQRDNGNGPGALSLLQVCSELIEDHHLGAYSASVAYLQGQCYVAQASYIKAADVLDRAIALLPPPSRCLPLRALMPFRRSKKISSLVNTLLTTRELRAMRRDAVRLRRTVVHFLDSTDKHAKTVRDSAEAAARVMPLPPVKLGNRREMPELSSRRHVTMGRLAQRDVEVNSLLSAGSDRELSAEGQEDGGHSMSRSGKKESRPVSPVSQWLHN